MKIIRLLVLLVSVICLQNLYSKDFPGNPSDDNNTPKKENSLSKTWPVEVSWNIGNQTICPGACVTLQATGGGSHDPPLTLTYTGAGSPASPTTPNVGVPDASFIVCPIVTTTYTVTASDAYAASPPAIASVTITVASCGCGISSLTTDTTTCDPSTNTYDLSGIITFSIPPTTGTLTVTDCNGNNQVFNPPFVSPINYNINGINANGAACTVTAVFSDSLSCTLTSNYNSPTACIPPVCTITSLQINDSNCVPETNTYDIDGTLTFTAPPTTGTLTLTDCHGNSQLLNAPFTSPTNYTINGINADGVPCNVTATFSDDPSCTITNNYLSPDICILEIIIPNIITPNDDSFNDLLVFKNLEFLENNLQVFNRWGTSVFKKDNYQNDWDGDDLSDGTYFFILNVIFPNSSSKIYKGTLSLIR